jgi:hypothetical protein
MVEGKPYSPLGEVMDDLARKRHVQGPHRICNRLIAWFGEDAAPSGVSVSKWMHGESHPNWRWIAMFAEAFELTTEEKVRLAWAYAFRNEYPKGP